MVDSFLRCAVAPRFRVEFWFTTCNGFGSSPVSLGGRLKASSASNLLMIEKRLTLEFRARGNAA